MSLKPPFFEQGREDSCALACLRMVLAHHGITVTEDELVGAAGKEGWLDPHEVAMLARRYGLTISYRQLNVNDLKTSIDRQEFPIVLLYRYPLDGVRDTHAVVPFRFTPHFVWFLDPLRPPPGERRVSIKKFEQARRMIGQWCVV